MNLSIRIVIRVSITTLGEFIPIMCTEHYNLLPKILIMSYSVWSDMNEIGPQLSLSLFTFPSVECVCLGLRFLRLQMLKLLTKCVLQRGKQCICCALSSQTSDKELWWLRVWPRIIYRGCWWSWDFTQTELSIRCDM
jgi:hypothetical protein